MLYCQIHRNNPKGLSPYQKTHYQLSLMEYLFTKIDKYFKFSWSFIQFHFHLFIFSLLTSSTHLKSVTICRDLYLYSILTTGIKYILHNSIIDLLAWGKIDYKIYLKYTMTRNKKAYLNIDMARHLDNIFAKCFSLNRDKSNMFYCNKNAQE